MARRVLKYIIVYEVFEYWFFYNHYIQSTKPSTHRFTFSIYLLHCIFIIVIFYIFDNNMPT